MEQWLSPERRIWEEMPENRDLIKASWSSSCYFPWTTMLASQPPRLKIVIGSNNMASKFLTQVTQWHDLQLLFLFFHANCTWINVIAKQWDRIVKQIFGVILKTKFIWILYTSLLCSSKQWSLCAVPYAVESYCMQGVFLKSCK